MTTRPALTVLQEVVIQLLGQILGNAANRLLSLSLAVSGLPLFWIQQHSQTRVSRMP